MKNLRKLLYPLSLLFEAITSIRNYFYDKGIFKSTEFTIPIIAVGNLSVGGTGKTPMVEYLIRLLHNRYHLATLSRGYKRKSVGFFLADESTKMEEIGDEPFQYFSKFKTIRVAVDAKRVEGVKEILMRKPETELIILDDAFQHRKIKAGFYVMLTSFDELFYKDLLLPAGNLRENASGIKRANLIVITKCPANISNKEMNEICLKIKKPNDQIFFTTIAYNNMVTNLISSVSVSDLKDDFIAVAGIAKPQFFYDFLNCSHQNTLTFPDHHHFNETDIKKILDSAKGRKIVTTEKDYMRLQNLLPKDQLYYLPIETKFINKEEDFNSKILNFINTK